MAKRLYLLDLNNDGEVDYRMRLTQKITIALTAYLIVVPLAGSLIYLSLNANIFPFLVGNAAVDQLLKAVVMILFGAALLAILYHYTKPSPAELGKVRHRGVLVFGEVLSVMSEPMGNETEQRTILYRFRPPWRWKRIEHGVTSLCYTGRRQPQIGDQLAIIYLDSKTHTVL